MGRVRQFFYQFPWGKALILWALVIFYFSARPGSPYPADTSWSFFLERKGAHVGEYFIFTLLWVAFLKKNYPGERLGILSALAVFISALYGVSDELHQYFVPFRGAKITDVGIDILGSILAIVFLFILRRIFVEKTKKPLK